MKNAACVFLGPVWAGLVVGFVIAVYCHWSVVQIMLIGAVSGVICGLYANTMLNRIAVTIMGGVCGASLAIGVGDSRPVVVVFGAVIALLVARLTRTVKYFLFSCWLLISAGVAAGKVPDSYIGTMLANPGIQWAMLGVSITLAVVLSRHEHETHVTEGRAGPDDNAG